MISEFEGGCLREALLLLQQYNEAKYSIIEKLNKVLPSSDYNHNVRIAAAFTPKEILYIRESTSKWIQMLHTAKTLKPEEITVLNAFKRIRNVM